MVHIATPELVNAHRQNLLAEAAATRRGRGEELAPPRRPRWSFGSRNR